MPMKMKHYCNHPGCNQLTTDRYCEQHTKQVQQRYDKQRGSAASRGYDSKWRAARDHYLMSNPICVRCEANGIVEPAVLVHHIKPIQDGGAILDTDNMQALCNDCHENIHGKDRFKQKA